MANILAAITCVGLCLFCGLCIGYLRYLGYCVHVIFHALSIEHEHGFLLSTQHHEQRKEQNDISRMD